MTSKTLPVYWQSSSHFADSLLSASVFLSVFESEKYNNKYLKNFFKGRNFLHEHNVLLVLILKIAIHHFLYESENLYPHKIKNEVSRHWGNTGKRIFTDQWV